MPSSSTGHVALDIDTLVKSIDQDILVEKRISANVSHITIYMVHDRAAGEDEYIPHYVPIGPYHRGLPSQQRTDVEKLRIIMRVQDVANLRGLLDEMKEMEEKVRACYDDRFGKMVGNEFVQMLLFDGCYLLACFVVKDTDLRIGANAAPAPGKVESRVRDSFYLLENQIPFSVLERIYEIVYRKDKGDLLRILTEYVQELLREQLYTGAPPGNIANPDPDHLLHLVHQQFTLGKTQPTQANDDGTNTEPTEANDGTNTQSTKRNDGTGRWRRATEYCSHANVRFERRVFDANSPWSVLDVKLDSGTLHMPRLRVQTNTWTILRNLIALEQLPRHSKKPYVTAYCLFMSELACTAEDVELLGSAGVVEHFLGSDAEAAKGFANLCNGVTLEIDNLSSNYLQPTWHELESRYRSHTQNFVGSFLQMHCRNPYYIAAFVVAVIFFASAVLQTVFTIVKK